MRREVLEALGRDAATPLSKRDIRNCCASGGASTNCWSRPSRSWPRAGEILLIKGSRYGLPKRMNLVVGRLTGHPDGYGFVRPEEGGGEDVMVRQREMNTALHGDRVVVRVEHSGRGARREGRVIRILERGVARVVGRIERTGDHAWLTPTDPRLTTDIHIPAHGLTPDAQTGRMAVARIVDFAARTRTPEGEIVEVLGEEGDPGVDEAVVIRTHGLPHEFGAEARREASHVPRTVTAAEAAGREDRRDRFIVTIDGETARDFDDAVGLETAPDGTRLLEVHIADVSHYVRPGTAIDREAVERGTSVYFPGMCIPMLPEELSNGICSLNPGEDRLAFAAFMTIDKAGRVTASRFGRTVIRSAARMTYTRVREIVEGRDQGDGLPPGAVEHFRRLAALAEQMRRLREADGSIDFDLPEPQIELDLRGRITDIFRSERTVAHRLIEEFMLAANRAVAGRLADLERPVLYRIHEEPNAEKLLLFARFAEGLGDPLPKGKKITPLALSKLMRQVEGKPEAPVLNNLLLRSLPQARYSEENVGHFGLAFDRYTHFTSPIRRYPDLVVHRVLAAMLGDAGGVAYKREELHVLGGHCSDRERAAVEAEREIVQVKKVRFLAERVGEEYDGFVVGVASFGIFVELVDHMVDGLVHVSSLEDDYYLFDEETQTLRGEHNGRTFRMGDKLRVRVESVSLERRRIDFRLVGPDAPKPRSGGRVGRVVSRSAAGQGKAKGKPAGGPARGRKRGAR